MNTDVYRDLPVLVTGHTGFKGSWLSEWLIQLGARPAGLSDRTSPLFDQLGLATRMPHQVADVTEPGAVAGALERHQPKLIVHLAAKALVRAAHREPVETFATNVVGTARVLEAVRQAGRPCVVLVATSDKCYAPGDGAPHRETDRLGGEEPYAASKAAAEHVVGAFTRSYFPAEQLDEHRVAVASLRAGNVIGGGDTAADRLVPDIIDALTQGRPVPLRHPDAVRPWQHVIDALAGYLQLAARLLDEDDPDRELLIGPWNFGPEPQDTVSVRELTEALIAAWGEGAWEGTADGGPAETHILQLDASRARQRLGWQPRYGVAQAAALTAQWHRRVQAGELAAHVTSNQLADHQS